MADTDRTIVKKVRTGIYRTAASDTNISDPYTVAANDDARPYVISRNGSENAATNVAEEVGCTILRKAKVRAIKLSSATAVANDATNYLKIYVYKYNSSGGSQTSLGSWNTATAAQGATTAKASHSLSLTSTVADLTVDANSTISFHVGKFGSGQALANFSLTIDAEEV